MTRSAFEPQGNVRLRPDRHKKLLNGYPWAHKGDLQSADPGLEPGGLVRIESSQGEFVGIGSYLPEGRFPVRLFTNRDERIDERFFLGRFESALKRRPLTEWNTDAYRAPFFGGGWSPRLGAGRLSEAIGGSGALLGYGEAPRGLDASAAQGV